MTEASRGVGRLFLPIGAALVLLISACGGEGPEIGRQTAAIVGGSPDVDPERLKVGIGRLLHNGSFICTATLIGANKQPYVLTAAHCLKDPNTGQIWSPPDSIVVEFEGERFAAAMLNPHPEENAANYENDIGIIELYRMPTNVRPALVARAYPKVGMQVTVVGYGATENAQPGTSRNAGVTAITAIRGSGYDLTAPSAAQSDGIASFCGGDSGGPTFTTRWGPETLIGVHSAIKTTGFDVAADDSTPDSSDTDLCANRETFDVAVANYLADDWIWEVTDDNINTFDSVPIDDSAGTTAGSAGDNVQAVVCGYTSAPPSTALFFVTLLGLAGFVRRRLKGLSTKS